MLQAAFSMQPWTLLHYHEPLRPCKGFTHSKDISRISLGLQWSASLLRHSLPVSSCFEIWWFRIWFKCKQRWLFTQDVLTKVAVTQVHPISCGFVCCIASMKEDWLDWCYLCSSALSSLLFRQSNCCLWDHIQINWSFQNSEVPAGTIW